MSKPIYYSAKWMNIWDDRIMEVLSREPGPMSVGDIHSHPAIRTSKSTVSRRCSRLAEEGLLTGYNNGVYDLTELGDQYLIGLYDAEKGEKTQSIPLVDEIDNDNGAN